MRWGGLRTTARRAAHRSARSRRARGSPTASPTRTPGAPQRLAASATSPAGRRVPGRSPTVTGGPARPAQRPAERAVAHRRRGDANAPGRTASRGVLASGAGAGEALGVVDPAVVGLDGADRDVPVVRVDDVGPVARGPHVLAEHGGRVARGAAGGAECVRARR